LLQANKKLIASIFPQHTRK